MTREMKNAEAKRIPSGVVNAGDILLFCLRLHSVELDSSLQ